MLKKCISVIVVLLSVFCSFKAEAKKPQYTKYKNIPYVEGSDLKKQQLDLYIPYIKRMNIPVHIFVHGGGWTIGDKRMIKSREAEAYTTNGVILVGINYRLSPDYKHPAHIEDCVSAIKWVKENIRQYGGDPNNMVLSGHSAGAHLVALLGTHPKYMHDQGLKLNMFKAIIPVDTASFDFRVIQQDKFVPRMRERAFGNDVQTLKDASPTQHVQRNTLYSPFFVYVTNRRAGAVQSSRAFVDALRQAEHKADLKVLKGRSHGDMKDEVFTFDSDIYLKILKVLNTWPR